MTSIGKKMDEANLYGKLWGPKHSFISTYLLIQEEKGENSKWKVVLDSFPKDADGMATFYTAEELKMLEGSAFPRMIYLKRQQLKHDYNLICGAIEGFKERFTFDRFHYWRSMVINRTFGGLMNGKETTFICPFSDLINHQHPNDTQWGYDDKSKNFIVRAIKDIPANKEIFNSYGNKCNTRFLLNYGMVVDDNFQFNEYSIFLEPIQFEFIDKDFFNRKYEWLRIHNLLAFDYNFKLSVRFNEYNMKHTLGYLRFITIDNISDYLAFDTQYNNAGMNKYNLMIPTSLYGET